MLLFFTANHENLFICEQFLLFLKRPLSLFLSWMALTFRLLTWCYSSGRTEDAQWELRIKVGSLADLLIRIRPNHFWLLICKMRFLNLPHYLLSIPYTWGTLIKETALKELKNKTSACSWGHSVNFHWGSAMPGALHIKNISLIRAQMHRQIHRVRWHPGGREVGLETTLLEVSNQRWREAHAVRHKISILAAL